MNAHGIPKHRQLPDKEAKLFKEVLVGVRLSTLRWLRNR